MMRFFKYIFNSAAVFLSVAVFPSAAAAMSAAAPGDGSVGAAAQKQSFSLGQWSEIHSGIMRNVARFYVDSLPLDKMYGAGLAAMLSQLDPYTVYVPESEQESFEMAISNSYGGIGAVIYKPDKNGPVVINEPYEGSPAARAGLRCGDEITHIDGADVAGLAVGDASARMKGKPGTKVEFTVRKLHSSPSAKPLKITITREKIHLPDIEYYGMLDDGTTGYIYQTGFTSGVSDAVREAVLDLKKRGMKRLVLDLRGNGGGMLDEAVKIVGLFVPRGTLVVTSKGTESTQQYRSPAEPVDLTLPLLVAVDSGSASSSEIVSGALQDLDRAVIAGGRTFGKGLVQRVLPLAYNGQLKVTVAKYYTPSGRCVQAKDYSRRNEDGSVGNIPDSLTSEFHTAGGRTVRDGGGITPDIKVESKHYERIAYAVALGGITSNYAIEYVRGHASIPGVDKFHLTDADYAAFADWAAKEKFDSRSEAATYYDLMASQMKKDGLLPAADSTLSHAGDSTSAVLRSAMKAIENVVKMEKREALMKAKDSILPLLEEEIAVRYYFQKAGVKVRLRTDTQLSEIIRKWDEYPPLVQTP